MSKVTMMGSFECQVGKTEELASFVPLVAGPPSMSSSQPIAALGLPL